MTSSRPAPATYTIKAGDTLEKISTAVYGIPTLGSLIYEANKDKIPDPNKLVPRTQIQIPPLPAKWTSLIQALRESPDAYQVFGGFEGVDNAASAAPYLLPPLPAQTFFNGPITLRVPNLNRASAPTGTAENDDFSFRWVSAPRQPVQAEITVKNNNVWKAAAAAANALRANFAAFLAQIEQMELTSKSLIAGGTAVIAQAITESLPLPVNLVPYYASGFNDGLGADKNPYVDLRPGMRLRLEMAASQFVEPASPFNGPAGAGQIVYSIVRVRGERVAFDSFLGSISAPQISTNGGGNIRTAAGLIDLQAAGSARRHYRLFYPTQLPAASEPGSSSIASSITLIGADTLADLNKATDAYINQGITTTAAPGSAPLVYVVFAGRITATVEIGVYITQSVWSIVEPTLEYVPLGTTMRQALDRMIPVINPRALHGPKPLMKLSRYWVGPDGIPMHRDVVFKPDMDTEADYSVYDLPLLKGDRVEIRLTEVAKPTA